jgi:hypothetical protein
MVVNLEETKCERDLGNSKRGYVEAAVNIVMKIQL